MHFESSFLVSGHPDEVIRCFSDMPLLASFLPGASVGPPHDDGSLPATLVASFGPKRIAFQGTLTHAIDAAAHAGEVQGHASADVRGARMAVKMRYQLAPAGEHQTRVQLHSDAQLTGVLAEFAKAGGVIVAEAMIAEFARQLSAHVEGASAEGAAAPAPQRAATLSVGTLLVLLLRRLKSWVWRAA